MLGENKNLKDPKDTLKDTTNMPAPYQSEGFSLTSVTLTYTKTNKLVTALYMVTDIMEKEEPLRNKLRTLGTSIISDIHHFPAEADKKIVMVMSFLDIAAAINLISEMNSNILKKEFGELKHSIQELKIKGSLSEFFLVAPESSNEVEGKDNINPQTNFNGRIQSTRLGVQKGSTLMKALSDVRMSDRNYPHSSDIATRPIVKKVISSTTRDDFDALKKQRREEIVKIVKTFTSTGGATITDIRMKASGALASCGEKTLQRELVSMVKDTVLKKFGEKRWSKYSV